MVNKRHSVVPSRPEQNERVQTVTYRINAEGSTGGPVRLRSGERHRQPSRICVMLLMIDATNQST